MIVRLVAFVVSLSATAALAASPDGTSRGFISATGRISAGGLQGDWQEAGELATGRFAIRDDLGAYRTADIYDGRTRWRVSYGQGSTYRAPDLCRRRRRWTVSNTRLSR
jgi:hypothetical protein